jgi:hypothetical protein
VNPNDGTNIKPFLERLTAMLGGRYKNVIVDTRYESEENYVYLVSAHNVDTVQQTPREWGSSIEISVLWGEDSGFRSLCTPSFYLVGMDK